MIIFSSVNLLLIQLIYTTMYFYLPLFIFSSYSYFFVKRDKRWNNENPSSYGHPRKRLPLLNHRLLSRQRLCWRLRCWRLRWLCCRWSLCCLRCLLSCWLCLSSWLSSLRRWCLRCLCSPWLCCLRCCLRCRCSCCLSWWLRWSCSCCLSWCLRCSCSCWLSSWCGCWCGSRRFLVGFGPCSWRLSFVGRFGHCGCRGRLFGHLVGRRSCGVGLYQGGQCLLCQPNHLLLLCKCQSFCFFCLLK